MRNAFANEINNLALQDPSIVLLSGDIGNRLFNPFKENHPERFFNCGVAEANMASVAAGLALEGFRPVTYTIASFNTVRCLEQIRNDICYHNLPVIIVGVGAGLSYANLGSSHHCLEDISYLRSIPNLRVICPGDSVEVKVLLAEALKQNSPVYLRMGKKGEPVIHKEVPSLSIGKAFVMQKGKKVALFSTGNMLPSAMEIANIFPEFEVISLHTVKPLDHDYLLYASRNFSTWITLEEHSLIGGLGSAISEWICDNRQKIDLIRIGTKDYFPHPIGSQNYLREEFEITVDAIIKKLQQRGL